MSARLAYRPRDPRAAGLSGRIIVQAELSSTVRNGRQSWVITLADGSCAVADATEIVPAIGLAQTA